MSVLYGYAVLSIVATLAVLWGGLRKREIKTDCKRNLSNARVCAIYRGAGARWYPHEMDDGTVRWYPVVHDYALDI